MVTAPGIGNERLSLRSLAAVARGRGRECQLAVTALIAVLAVGPRWAAAAENQWPVADAGRFHVTCVGNGPVTLHGRGADPDGDAVTNAWRQSEGPAVLELAGAGTANVTVTPPQAGTYVLALTIDDGRGGRGIDTARVVCRLRGGEGWRWTVSRRAIWSQSAPLTARAWRRRGAMARGVEARRTGRRTGLNSSTGLPRRQATPG